jgi:hypothetical protein
MITRSSLMLALPAVSALLLAGCRDPQVVSYRIPKEKERPPSGAGPASAASTAVPHLHYKVPAGWTEQSSSTVRVASFSIAGPGGNNGDMAVTQFPGNVGGDLANVNRWRGQLQLGPIDEAQLAQVVRNGRVPAGEYSLVELTSDAALIANQHKARILGAWIKHPERTWFFKLTGPAELVAAQRGAFMQFLESVEFATDTHDTPSSSAQSPSSAATNRSPHAGPTASSGASITWTAPANWEQKPLTQMRKGSFTLRAKNGAEADFSIISFPGEAGGIVDNLNRWRGQLQLPALAPGEMASTAKTIAHGTFRFTVVDYVAASGEPRNRILGAVLPLESETYFFKITGPDAVIEEHKAAFLEFLKTIKTP